MAPPEQTPEDLSSKKNRRFGAQTSALLSRESLRGGL